MPACPLNYRLRNCLLTILEFEDILGQTSFGATLRQEYRILKKIVRQLEKVTVEEKDVRRIEAATRCFLTELKEILGPHSLLTTRILQ